MRRLAAVAALAALPATAEPLRIATFSPALTRDGPGLLLRDIESGRDRQVAAVVEVVKAADADILLLTGFDWDHDNAALTAFARTLADAGVEYPHLHASRPNRGMATGIDLDGDGRRGGPGDAQGFGSFTGEKAMALLSRHPIGPVTDHSALLWRDLPGHVMPPLPDEVAEVQRLSSAAHWDAVVTVLDRPLHLLAWYATPPAFDGPEGRNRRRNHDEAVFWLQHLPDAPFVLLGNANLDPHDGDGWHQAIHALLEVTQDTRPASDGARLAPQDGSNASHRGDPALDTADWPADRTGNLRVDYVLPARGLKVLGTGTIWPEPSDPLAETVAAASRHRLVWVDLNWPPAR